MAGLMAKTKKELVSMIRELQAGASQASGSEADERVVELEGRLKSMEDGLRDLEKNNQTIQSENQDLREAGARAEQKAMELKERLIYMEMELQDIKKNNEELEAEKLAFKKTEAELANQIEDLTIRLDEIKNETLIFQNDLEQKQREASEYQSLLESLFGGDDRVLILDRNLTVRFASGMARDYFTEQGLDRILGSGALDLLCGVDQIKLEKKFNKALLQGRKEKIKKIRSGQGDVKGKLVKIKLSPTAYKGEPGLILKIQDS